MGMRMILVLCCVSNIQADLGGIAVEKETVSTSDSNNYILPIKPLDVGYLVTPPTTHDPLRDAVSLHKTITDLVINEMKIIDILARKTNLDRLKIDAEYRLQYKKNLTDELNSKLEGDFKKLIIALLKPLPVFYAEELHDATRGLGTDEDALIEILCSLSNQEIRQISLIYEKIFGKSLVADISHDTHGDFRQLMVGLSSANRDESDIVNKSEAVAEAKQLLEAGQLKWGTDESKFIKILSEINFKQLRSIFDEYENLSEDDITKAIKKEFSGDVKRGLLAIIGAIRNLSEYFAERLHDSLGRLGVDEKQLIRIMVTRNEFDLRDIKIHYKIKYENSLVEDIAAHTSGYFKKCLLALLGEF